MIRKDFPIPEVLPLHVRLSAAARFLSLAPHDLAGILGLPASEMAKILSGCAGCPAETLAAAEQLVALFKVLNRSIGKEEVANRWLRTVSPAFNCKPLDMLAQPGGTRQVLDYLKTLHHQI